MKKEPLKHWLDRSAQLFFFLSLCLADKIENGDIHQRRRGTQSGISNGQEVGNKQAEEVGRTGSSWRRILLLILAITIHNIPGLSQLSGFVQETQKLWLWLRVCGWRLYCSLGLSRLKVADSFLYTLFTWKTAAFTYSQVCSWTQFYS